MSDPVHNVHFVQQAPEGTPTPPSRLREWLSVILMLVGTIALSVGVAGFLGSLWAGVAVSGFVLTGVGLLLGNNR